MPAIDGHKVIMTGGKIEAAGIGITATGKSVEITGTFSPLTHHDTNRFHPTY